MKWLKFCFRCFVIACISFKQNSWNGNYFSKLWGGVSVFTGMNQPCEWNKKYARHLLARLCVLQTYMRMRASKLDSTLQLIINHSSITQCIQDGVQFTSTSDLVHLRFVMMCHYSRLWVRIESDPHSQLQSPSSSESFTVEQAKSHGQNKQMLILLYLCMVSASYPNKSS